MTTIPTTTKDPGTRARTPSEIVQQDYFRRYLLRRCVSLIDDFHLAEDIVQEVTLTVLQYADTYDPEKSAPSTLPVRIAIQRCLNILKRRRRLPMCRLAVDPAVSADPSAPVEVRDEIDRVHWAMGDCTPLQKLVLTRCVLDEEPQTDVAKEAGVSRQAVNQSCSQAVRNIRRRLNAGDRPLSRSGQRRTQRARGLPDLLPLHPVNAGRP